MKAKRIISVILAALMLVGTVVFGATVSAADMPFKDVKANKWFYDEVLYVYERGLMTGTSNDKFEPNASLTRAMFITILGRLAGAEETASNKFSDIKKNSWYSGYVGWAVDNGIVTGYEDGTFKPNKALTREEMAACISRYVDFMGINMPRESTAPVEFADKGKIAKWARDYVEVLRRAGIANGDQNEKYNPKSNITRAEMATVIMNLIAAEAKAWQGYTPDPVGDGYAVYGASYLYYNGTAVSGGMGTSLEGEESGGYTYLSAYMDATTAKYHGTAANATGICTSVFDDLNLDELPVVKIAYTFEGESAPETLKGHYVVNTSTNSWSWTFYNAYINEEFDFVPSADDAGYASVTFDLSALLEANSHVNDAIDISHILVYPFAEDYAGEGKLNIRYIAFFKDQASADSFDSADLDDYLKNYFCYSSIDYIEADDSVYKTYDTLLSERVNEILNSESAYTPEMIEAAGGKCYYVSSINGKEGNDGRSPETPFASPSDLWNIMAGGAVHVSVAHAGDGVFFERGSIWYADSVYGPTGSGFTALQLTNGVTYSAYGEGEKPVFTVAFDFRDTDNVGIWNATEWDNVWTLDDRYINSDPRIIASGKDARFDIGNIVFNEGESLGIRVRNAGNTSVFGEDKITMDYGLVTPNGIDFFTCGGDPCTDPGTALNNNYEFFYDMENLKLYLYWDRGNPADSFDDIKVSRRGEGFTIFYAGNGKEEDTPPMIVDNLCAMYSSDVCADVYNYNSIVMNCEFGYCGGELSSIATGVGVTSYWASNVKFINNYLHDIQDGPISVQTAGETYDLDNPSIFKDIEIANNVVVACGNGIEVWNKPGDTLENGLAANYSEGLYYHDNIYAYTGYGICLLQEEKRAGTVYCTRYEMVDCKIENDITMYAVGQVGIEVFSSDTQKRGYELINNTYILNEELCTFTTRRNNFNNYWHHTLATYGNGVTVPYEYRFLTYMAALGIGNGETYYYMSEPATENEKNWGCFMTGYHVENGNASGGKFVSK